MLSTTKTSIRSAMAFFLFVFVAFTRNTPKQGFESRSFERVARVEAFSDAPLTFLFVRRRRSKASYSQPIGSSSRTPSFISPPVLALSGRRPKDGNDDRNDWISYLEEEFHKDHEVVTNNAGEDFRANNTTVALKKFETPLETYTNPLEFLDAIGFEDYSPIESSDDLCVVLFFAHYCRTCHRANIPFKQMAYEYAENFPSTRFLRFETSSLSPQQFRSLGIDRVPFVHIYNRGDLVASFSALQKQKLVLYLRLMESLQVCRQRSHSDWKAFRAQYSEEIQNNRKARTQIRIERWKESTNYPKTNTHYYQSVKTLTSEAELLQLLHPSPSGGTQKPRPSLLVVMYHSHFDPSCRRAQHKFRKLSEERNQKRQSMTCSMARIEASVVSDQTLVALGVRKFPHIQVYYEEKCVASFSIPRSYLFGKILHEALDTIDARTQSDWALFYREHNDDIESQRLAIESIRNKSRPQ